MKVQEANSGILSNFEVLDLLRSYGANQEDLTSFGSVTPSECKVHEYLVQSPAGTQTKDALRHFIEQIDKYNLTKGECLQVMNLRPSSAVEVHLVVEDCEERMTPEQVEEFLGMVDVLPQPPERPEEATAEGDNVDGDNTGADDGGDIQEMEE